MANFHNLNEVWRQQQAKHFAEALRAFADRVEAGEFEEAELLIHQDIYEVESPDAWRRVRYGGSVTLVCLKAPDMNAAEGGILLNDDAKFTLPSWIPTEGARQKEKEAHDQAGSV